MFYRLRDAARRRPTRALMIAAGIILLTAFLHACAIYWAFMKSIEPRESITPAQLSSRLATALSYARLGLAMDWIALGLAMLLLGWAGWRMCRRQP